MPAKSYCRLQGCFMFHIHWESLTTALFLSIAYAFYVTHLLHRRYDRQFGWGFMASGIVAFLMPCFLVIGIPVYFILAAQAPPVFTIALLTPLFLAYGVAAFWLKRKLLSKIFPKTEPSHNLPG